MMTFLNRRDLENGFKSLGLKSGDTLMVHSSLKSLGYVEGGVEAVVDSLVAVVGEAGTLIVPALSGKREDSSRNPPVFDVVNTPCWTGIIPETVRKMSEAKRSLHPTHSAVAVGANKDFVISGHEKSKSPCDKESPYWKNVILGGYVLLIGVDQESNTSIHSCEEIADVPYHLQEEVTEILITGYEGESIRVVNRLHDWDKPATNFNKLDNLYEHEGIMRMARIGNANVRCINAREMFEFTINLLREDPLFLLC